MKKVVFLKSLGKVSIKTDKNNISALPSNVNIPILPPFNLWHNNY